MATPYRGFPTDLEAVIMYLRKSREDVEAEERAIRNGQIDVDVLSRHRRRLLEIARTHRLNIIGIFEEVVSGELIDERPEVLKVLDWVESGTLDGVLCIDIDRLGRGDSADQGIIQRTFRDSNTLIITEDKVYDLQDDNDEEQVEFKAFFARRELKRITKRMQGGRVDSVNEGAYIGTWEPYGYLRDRNKGLMLFPSERADIVKMIFDWYVNEGVGGPTIAERLNAMGLPCPTNDRLQREGRPQEYDLKWTSSTINAILKNEVYVGRIQWRKTKTVRRKMDNGRYKKVKSVNRPRDEWIDRKGRHDPLVDIATFEKAQKITATRANGTSYKDRKPKNPLRGLVVCRICGSKMQRRPYSKQQPHLICATKGCNRSSRFEFVEAKLLEALRAWYQDYKIQYDVLEKQLQRTVTSKIPVSILDEIDKEINQLLGQKNQLHTLLERGIYDIDTFVERNAVIASSIKKLQIQKEEVVNQIQNEKKNEEAKSNIIPLIRHVLDSYDATDDPNEKNHLLRQVISRVEYFKADEWVDDQFELDLYPLL